MVRGEPTGQTKTWTGDVVATAKRDLKAGEKLDGEGGFTVYGKLMTAQDSMKIEGLPIGLAHGFVLKRDVKKDDGLSWQDIGHRESRYSAQWADGDRCRRRDNTTRSARKKLSFTTSNLGFASSNSTFTSDEGLSPLGRQIAQYPRAA